MEVLRSCRCVAQLDVVFGRQNKEAFNSRRGVFWSLTFITVREEEHEPVLLAPFVFSCDEILIDHDLGAVDEVAKLRLPHHECRRVCLCVPIFVPERCILTEQRVVHPELGVFVGECVKWNPLFAGFVIDE